MTSWPGRRARSRRNALPAVAVSGTAALLLISTTPLLSATPLLSTTPLLSATLAAQGPTDDAHAVDAPAGVTVDASIDYYDLDAADLRGVVETLNRMRLEGPQGRPSQGLTRYWISPNWRVQAGGGACRVVHVDVSVEVVITLPRWRAVRGRPVEEREGWARIETAIREHEYGHRDLTVAAAGELREEMAGLSARGCGTLRDVVSSTISIVNGRLEEAHAELDRDTPPRISIRPGGR